MVPPDNKCVDRSIECVELTRENERKMMIWPQTSASTQPGMLRSLISLTSFTAQYKWVTMITQAVIMGNQPRTCGTMRLT